MEWEGKYEEAEKRIKGEKGRGVKERREREGMRKRYAGKGQKRKGS